MKSNADGDKANGMRQMKKKLGRKRNELQNRKCM